MLSKFKDSLCELIQIGGMHPSSVDNPKILVAVSGGIDSMCMAQLFSDIYYSNYAIATVNFALRGEESDGDQELVKKWAGSKGIECYSTTFDTHSYANDNGISTQMAARDLRYDWFDSLIKEHGFDYLAIAHNLNDSVETFFLNILRGTGLQGLTGIRKKNGYIIRPLLTITRREIAEYVKLHDIPFREDSTNAQSHYSRNRLRNMVFPEFEMINQSFLNTVEKDMANVQAAVDILEEILPQKKEYLLDLESNRISIERLLEQKRPDYWLYAILDDYGFNYEQVRQITCLLDGQPGKEFHSDSHLLIKDREWLLLYPKGSANSGSESLHSQNKGQTDDIYAQTKMLVIDGLTVGKNESLQHSGRELTFHKLTKTKVFNYSKFRKRDDAMVGDLFAIGNFGFPEPEIFLDEGLISYPLEIRVWQQGDKFMPLGMKGFKKLSDFLTDMKLDKVTKTNTLVVFSGGKIIAVPGYRVDDRFKVSSSTLSLLRIDIK